MIWILMVARWHNNTFLFTIRFFMLLVHSNFYCVTKYVNILRILNGMYIFLPLKYKFVFKTTWVLSILLWSIFFRGTKFYNGWELSQKCALLLIVLSSTYSSCSQSDTFSLYPLIWNIVCLPSIVHILLTPHNIMPKNSRDWTSNCLIVLVVNKKISTAIFHVYYFLWILNIFYSIDFQKHQANYICISSDMLVDNIFRYVFYNILNWKSIERIRKN